MRQCRTGVQVKLRKSLRTSGAGWNKLGDRKIGKMNCDDKESESNFNF